MDANVKGVTTKRVSERRPSGNSSNGAEMEPKPLSANGVGLPTAQLTSSDPPLDDDDNNPAKGGGEKHPSLTWMNRCLWQCKICDKTALSGKAFYRDVLADHKIKAQAGFF